MNELPSVPHQLTLDDRRRLTIAGVLDVDSFDEQTIIAQTPLGELTIGGHDLQICRLSIDVGDLVIEGNIASLEYSENRVNKTGLFKKLFR